MELTIAELFQAFIAGFISFVSPCILPLIPAYISYISGETFSNIESGVANTRKIFLNSIGFVIGFSIVFILLGATATTAGKFLSRNKTLFEIIAGIIIIIFGLHTAHIIRINFLNYEKRVQKRQTSGTFLSALLMGFAFSFGWTPCVGPILGTILIQASMLSTVSRGVMLLVFYSLGLGIPFIITAIAINKFLTAFGRIKEYFGQIEMFAGILIISIGIALMLRIGLHTEYIIASIILSAGFALLSTKKLNIYESIGLLIIICSLPLMLNINFIKNGTLNANLLGMVILVIMGIISMYKVGKENE